MTYAEIAFPRKIGLDRETLTYLLPETRENTLIGRIARVPLKNHATSGIIVKIHENKPSFKTLEINEILPEAYSLMESQMRLMEWMSKYYFCPIYKLIKLFLPKKILSGKEIKAYNPTQKDTSEQIIRTKNKTLTKDQKSAIERIIHAEKNKFLIQGITGSGKTEIYARLTENYIKNDKQALILVPEISLTPQTIEYFERHLEIRACIINSKISENERTLSWQKIHSNEAKLIIGSRSSIFAPFKNLGIIIIDEEHESSYKQENSPRYKTHTIAEEIIGQNPEIKLIFGSATPNVETAEKLKDTTIILKERIGNSKLPEIEIVDLKDEFKKKNYSIFSEKLGSEIKKSLKRNEQIILFLNRRGSATSIVCRDCGYTEKCLECEIPLTYHAKTLAKPTLICHHCGKLNTPPEVCPFCKSPNIRFLGIGTQKIEDETKKIFPNARVLRADKDTTSKKDGFKKIYQDFKSHKADILIGTQMIAKGLHLPKVNLVGIILADIGLNIPDFRVLEKTFQLITQVSGRAGRAQDSLGKVIIQTYNPENLALIYSQKNDYKNFFEYEIGQRRLLDNPPFSQLAKIIVEDSELKKCMEKTDRLENLLWKTAGENSIKESLEINNYPAYLIRFRKKYRHVILIKAKENNLIHKLLENLPKEYIMDASIKIDIDPSSTI
ncbi:primosomal protein N' [Candidatus Peregrinibacteria bacterium]|nr:primosomal protein N' [Candidatus Peregrinibacteria bacterium]